MWDSYWALESLCSLNTLAWHFEILYLKVIITHKFLKYFWQKRHLQGVIENNSLIFTYRKRFHFPTLYTYFWLLAKCIQLDSEVCSVKVMAWPHWYRGLTKVKAVLWAWSCGVCSHTSIYLLHKENSRSLLSTRSSWTPSVGGGRSSSSGWWSTITDPVLRELTSAGSWSDSYTQWQEFQQENDVRRT